MKKSELKAIIKECLEEMPLNEATGISRLDNEISKLIDTAIKLRSNLNGENASGAKHYYKIVDKFIKDMLK